MTMDNARSQSGSVRVVRPSVFFQGEFPKGMAQNLSPASLKREGFVRIAQGRYRRDFSGVLSLTVGKVKGRGHFYRWDVHFEHLRSLNWELATLRKRIEDEERRLRKKWKRAVAADRVAKGKKGPDAYVPNPLRGEFIGEWISAAQSIRSERTALRDRYRDFIDLFVCTGDKPQTFRCSCFPIEACSNTRDLRVYLDFVKLYLQVFRGIEKAKTGRAQSRVMNESAIMTYYAAVASIRKIRQRSDEGVDCDTIEQESSDALRPFVEKALLPGEAETKKWESKASEIALDLVAPMYGTTPQNLRDLLHKGKPYTVLAQDYVATLNDPEALLSGDRPLPEILPMAISDYGKGSLDRMIRSFLLSE